ncbi:MAG TPA: hypothetical protein VMH86_00740 [Rhizomicrobium sp.]|nr:hypothetical protein [Rhizomicrobium sp.]
MDRQDRDDDLEAMFARIRTWPKDWQEHAIARFHLMEHDLKNPYVLSPEELADIREGLAEADRGEFATGEDIEALFGRRFCSAWS